MNGEEVMLKGEGKREEDKGIIRTGIRMDKTLHKEFTERLRELRYSGGEFISIDNKIAELIRQWLLIQERQDEPYLTGNVENTPAFPLVPPTKSVQIRTYSDTKQAYDRDNQISPEGDAQWQEVLTGLLASEFRKSITDVLSAFRCAIDVRGGIDSNKSAEGSNTSDPAPHENPHRDSEKS